MTTTMETHMATGNSGIGGGSCEGRGGSCAGVRGGSCEGQQRGGSSVAGDEPAIDETDRQYAPIDSFDDMGLREDLLRGIYTHGFERPSAIQQRAIRPLVDMRDLIAQAQSGTGKTACFSIGLLQNIDTNVRRTQAI
eukprot:7387726-Prymnesium_polylepis.1